MASSTLHIGRLHNQYFVPAELQRPEDVRFACEAALVNLPHALASALESRLSASDPGLWFIWRLPLDFAINPEVNLLGAPQIWAQEIADAMTATMQAGGDGVVHFPDRASYLAHFLLDLSNGSAWGKWFYARMDGLRMLPTSAALRTAICDSPEDGLKALTLLSDAARYSLIRTLQASDADRVLAAFSATGSNADATECVVAIANAWPEIVRVAAYDEERRRLLLFIAVARATPALAGEALRQSIVSTCRLARRVASDSDAGLLLQALRNGDTAALYRFAGVEDAGHLMTLLASSPEALSVLLDRVAARPATKNEETRFTAFGGAFLLFPLLDDLPLEAATHDWPSLGDVSAAQAIRFLVLILGMGRERALGCFRDPLLRDLMQIDPQISAQQVAEWLSAISHELISNFACEICSWHLYTGAAEAQVFQLVAIEHELTQIVVLQDSARGVWLHAGGATNAADELQAIFRGLPQPETVQCDASLLELGGRIFPGAQLQPLLDSPADKMAADLDYLCFPPELGCPRRLELALAAAAQSLLRLFAYKLTGFAHSSLDYLYSNFLDCHGAVTETAEQRVVCLGRPPLHLVLSMAGLNRCSYQFAWLGGRSCAIFPEG